MLCPLLRRGRRRREGAADRTPPLADRRPPLGRRAPPPVRGAPRPPRARGRSRLDRARSPGTPGRIGTHPARSRHPCVHRNPRTVGHGALDRPPKGAALRGCVDGWSECHAERDPRRPRPASPRALLRDQPGSRLRGGEGALREPAQRLLAAAARGGLHAAAAGAGRAVASARRRGRRDERRAPHDARLVGPPRRGLRRQRGAARATREGLRAGVARVRRQGGLPRGVQGTRAARRARPDAWPAHATLRPAVDLTRERCGPVGGTAPLVRGAGARESARRPSRRSRDPARPSRPRLPPPLRRPGRPGCLDHSGRRARRRRVARRRASPRARRRAAARRRRPRALGVDAPPRVVLARARSDLRHA